MSCADRRRFFPRCRARFFAVRRTASGSPENRDSGVARPEGPASSGESCHAVLQDEEEGHLPAIPRAQSWHRSDTWLPPSRKATVQYCTQLPLRGGFAQRVKEEVLRGGCRNRHELVARDFRSDAYFA